MNEQFDYNSAIIRPPPKSYSSGLTTRTGNPDYGLALRQWGNYCSILIEAGIKLILLPAEQSYPDSCFVEDAAVILKEKGIIIPTNICQESRTGEKKTVLEKLAEKSFTIVEGIKNPGTLDGGDVRRIENAFYIGESSRTNSLGIRQFRDIVKKYGYETYPIPVKSVLHLSTGSSYLGDNVVAAIKELAEFYQNYGRGGIENSPGEENSAGLF